MNSPRRPKDRNQAAVPRSAPRRGVPMSPSNPGSTNGRLRPQRARQGHSGLITAIVAGIIAVIIIAMIVVKFVLPFTRSSATVSAADQPVSPTVMQDLISVSDATENQVGAGTAQNTLIPVGTDVLKDSNGHPLIVYVGAEYCPFCAAERWGLIVALSRFGKFSGLRTSHSASDDVYPNTPTFTFVGSSYQSDYIDFSPVELQSNQRVGNTYQTLQTPTPQQQQLLNTYDGPPYVAAQSAGSIPFIDLANRYVISGAQIDAGSLDNRTWEQIAANLNDPNSADAKAIVGEANQITAGICQATGDTPANVCTQPAIKTIESQLSSK